MKTSLIKNSLGASILALALTSPAGAQTCYQISGEVNTTNVTPVLQVGDIDLTLSNADGVLFSDTGSIVGTITGAQGFDSFSLTHTISFSLLIKLITRDDRAEMTGEVVRESETDGTACSFYIHEVSDQVLLATGLFGRVSQWRLVADGYVSSCLDDNANYFELTGMVCFD